MSDDDETKREGHGSQRSTPFAKEEASAAVKQEYLSRGTLVGRYIIVDMIGEGGMGVVYRGYDPELDRRVAIKLLQTRSGGSTSGGDKAWLVREAQALARLSHPNVVAVHDVGTLADDRVFVAMELVEGDTLRDWLKAAKRSWREVLPVMQAAGEGLAAAHDAGLVHRDFKPDNVLVGADGRVRVMDFGLARLRPDDDSTPSRRASDLHVESRSPLSEKLTIAGAVVGTPAYMAPEVYKGEAADARTDQFAFGVALYEALFAVRPYDKKDLQPPVTAPRPKTPPDTGVPAKVVRATLRAIAIEHAQRFPSMRELLAELRVDPHARRRLVLAIAGLAAAAVLAVGGGYVVKRGVAAKPVPCQGTEERLAGVWDAKAKTTIRAAFEATKKAFAAASYAGVERALDRYTGEWTRAVTDSCQATRVRGTQTEDVLTLREQCFADELEELRVLSGLLGQADAMMVEQGDKIVFGLEPVAKCANVAMLRAPDKPAPQIVDQVHALEKKLAEVRANLIAGKVFPALVASQQIADTAKKLGYEPLVAEARLVHGAALLGTGALDQASEDYKEATYAAIRGKRDDYAADAGLGMAMAAADADGKIGEARVWLGHAAAASTRAGVDRALENRLLETEGIIAAEAGDFTTAIAKHEKLLANVIATQGADAPELFAREIEVGSTYSRGGMYARALPHYEHALALRQASVGPDHPDVALTLSNLGAVYNHTHDYARARAAFERAIVIREKYYGKNSPLIVPTLDNLAEMVRKQGDVGTALALQERALALAKILPGTAHPTYHQLATDYGDTLTAAKRFADAHKHFDALFELEAKNGSPLVPATKTSRAELALAEGKWAEAQTFAQQAVEGYEAASGKENPLLWRPLTALARAQLGKHEVPAARRSLERALAIAKKAQITDDDIGPTRELYAHLPP